MTDSHTPLENTTNSAWFPLFADLNDSPVLLIGGDEVAVRKARRLLQAGANLRVIAPALAPELAQWEQEKKLTWLGHGVTDELLTGHLLIVVADTEPHVRDRARRWANAHNILINVVDQQHASSAIVPAVVDRSPLVVAVSSGGNAPELARMVRSQIERLLPSHLGSLATLLGSFKLPIRNRFQGFPERRNFLRWALDGKVAKAVQEGQLSDAKALVKQALQGKDDHAVGHVSLVGAGPGEPELLTLRALHRIQTADTIVYDGLVDKRILDYARRDVLLIDVSKRPGEVRITQEGIHTLLAEHALKGEQVVRLKCGDPMIFGRGGEEVEWLRSQGIHYDVVPGITAASACASYAGFPLTQRGFAQSVRFVTGHCERSIDRLDWQALAQDRQTLAFYMSVGQLTHIEASLLRHGRNPETPVAIVENGTRVNQRVLVGKLSELTALAEQHQAQAPAILYVGEVAALAEQGSWFASPIERLKKVA